MPLKRVLVLAAIVAVAAPVMAGSRDRNRQESSGQSPFVLAPRAVPGLDGGQSELRRIEPIHVGPGGAMAIFEPAGAEVVPAGRRPDGLQVVYLPDEELAEGLAPNRRPKLKIMAIMDDGATSTEVAPSGE